MPRGNIPSYNRRLYRCGDQRTSKQINRHTDTNTHAHRYTNRQSERDTHLYMETYDFTSKDDNDVCLLENSD